MQWHEVIDLVAVVLSPEVVGTLGVGAVLERVLRPVGAIAGILSVLRAAKLSELSSNSLPASAASPSPSAKSPRTVRKPRSSDAANDNRPAPPDEYPQGYDGN